MSVVWLILSRRRKRSGSRWSSGSSSRSRSRSRSPFWNKTLPDKFRIVYQYSEGGGSKWFMVTIPSNQLQFFDKVEPGCYIPHDHVIDPTMFRTMKPDKYLSYLGRHDHVSVNYFTVLGSHAYSLFRVNMSTDFEWWSFCLNEDDGPRRLSSPQYPTRSFCTTTSVRGKVYLLGGLVHHDSLSTESSTKSIAESFAEVYDPVTDQWSNVPQPPNVDALIRRHNLFSASLGDSEGKILVYDYDTPNPMFYFYDVVAELWISHRPRSSLRFEPEYILNKAIINEEDGHLYWIDSRECFLYCLNWKTMQVFSGPIVGVEHERFFIDLKSLYGVMLHHLWGEYFCLIWCTSFLSVPPCFRAHHHSTTEYHFTFLRVVKGHSRDSLSAFVLGCFMDSYYDRPFICHSSIA